MKSASSIPPDIGIAVSTREVEKIRSSLKNSVREGTGWAVMIGFGESYLAAFAEFLKATTFQMGLLTSVPQLFSSLLQLFAVKSTHVTPSRKRIVVLSVILQAMMWLVMIAVSYFTQNVYLFVGLVSLYFIFGAFSVPAWTSWMGDLVPERIRGRYFGKRNRTIGMISTISVITAGIILHFLSSWNTWQAFTVLFSIAFVGRLVSALILTQQYEPSVELETPRKFGFIPFLKKITHENFGVFSLFVMGMLFAVYLAVPLFVILWLRFLHFSYFQFMAIIATTSISSFIAMGYWGRYADLYGNRWVMNASTWIIILLPGVWVILYFMPHAFYFPMALCIQVFGGASWAGFNLGSANYVYDSVPRKDRLRYVSYHNAMKGVAIFAGSLIGGWLGGQSIHIPGLTSAVPTGILVVFGLSTLLRLVVFRMYFSRVKEVRVQRDMPPPLRFAAFVPMQGLVVDPIIGLNRTLQQFRVRLQKIWQNVE